MMRLEGDIVIYPGIWGRQPTAEALLAHVTYDVILVYLRHKYMPHKWQYQGVTNVRACLLETPFSASGLTDQLKGDI